MPGGVNLTWRMNKMCSTCPFQKRGPGLYLRRSLRRWREILQGLREGQHFYCHNTVEFDPDDENEERIINSPLICAGSIAWQERWKCPSLYVRFMEKRAKRAGT